MKTEWTFNPQTNEYVIVEDKDEADMTWTIRPVKREPYQYELICVEDGKTVIDTDFFTLEDAQSLENRKLMYMNYLRKNAFELFGDMGPFGHLKKPNISL